MKTQLNKLNGKAIINKLMIPPYSPKFSNRLAQRGSTPKMIKPTSKQNIIEEKTDTHSQVGYTYITHISYLTTPIINVLFNYSS